MTAVVSLQSYQTYRSFCRLGHICRNVSVKLFKGLQTLIRQINHFDIGIGHWTIYIQMPHLYLFTYSICIKYITCKSRIYVYTPEFRCKTLKFMPTKRSPSVNHNSHMTPSFILYNTSSLQDFLYILQEHRGSLLVKSYLSVV